MRFPFIGGAYGGRSKEMNPQECINLYPVIDKADAKSITALYGTPGLTEHFTLPEVTGYDPGRVRGMLYRAPYLYTVIKNKLYRYAEDGDILPIETLVAETNLVTNGDMEINGNWASVGTLITSGQTSAPGLYYEGSYGWLFATDAGNRGVRSDTFTTVTGTSYVFSAWVRADGSGKISIRIRRGNDSDHNLSRVFYFTDSGPFTFITATFTEDFGGNGAYVEFLSFTGSTAYHCVDDVRIYSVSEPSQNIWMANNNTHLMVVEPGTDGWTYAFGGGAGTGAVIADADFPTPRGLCYLDGYFIVTQDGTNKWYISALNDPTSWDALDYSSVESKPDILRGCIALQGQVALIGSTICEFHAHTGASDWPFRRVAVVEQGLGAEGSLSKFDNSLFFLNMEREVVSVTNYQVGKLSTDSIDYHIQGYEVAEDAVGFCYQQEGHVFYQLSFPTADATWVYDVTTGLWHERQSYDGSGGYGRHRGNCYAQAGENKLIGDYNNGIIYTVDMDAYTDNGEPIRRRRVCPVLHNEQKRIFYHRLEVDFEGGVGLTSGDGSDPEATLEWSDDGGNTYGNEHTAKIGAEGDYSQRTMWHRLGSGRNRVFRVTVEEPVKVVMIDAALEASPGGH